MKEEDYIYHLKKIKSRCDYSIGLLIAKAKLDAYLNIVKSHNELSFLMATLEKELYGEVKKR